AVAIVDAYGDLDRTAVAIDHRSDPLDAGVVAAVVERIHGKGDRLAGRKRHRIALGDAQVGTQVAEIGNIENRSIGRQQLAALDPASRDDAVERRADFTLGHHHAGEGDLGTAHGKFGFRLVMAGFGDELARQQLFAAFHLVLAALQVRFGFTQLQLAVRRIDAGEQLALLHLIAFLDQQLHDGAGYFGDDLCFLFGLEGRGRRIARGQFALFDAGGFHRLTVFGPLFLGRRGGYRRGPARATGEQGTQGDEDGEGER